MNPDLFDGPIPGENLTTDTRNYPWHRPPEFTDLNEAIEDVINRMMDEEPVAGLVAAASMGMTVSQLTRTVLMMAVGAGKITVDFAVLMAGPVYRAIEIVLKATDTPYESGLYDTLRGVPTKAEIRYVSGAFDADAADEARDVGAEIKASVAGEPRGGFMERPMTAPADEQSAMLGYAGDDEEMLQ